MAVPELLDRLLRAHGVSGSEAAAAAVVRDAAAGLARVESDVLGSTVVRIGEGRPLLALVAHVDQVGMAVAHVDDDGLLAVTKIANWDPRAAVLQRVRVLTGDAEVPGVVGRRTKGDEKPGWDELYVDVGARDGEEARSLVRPGDPIRLDAPPVELANGRVASAALDNRASVHVALEALLAIADDPPCEVALVATVQEELAHAGAASAMRRLRPDVALVLDVTYATDVPEADPRDAGDHRLGGGPAIFRGPVIHPAVFELLVETAEAEGIPHTIEVGATTWTDADDVYIADEGIATGVVSVPLRRMHTGVETVELGDLARTAQLLAAFARRLAPGLDLSR